MGGMEVISTAWVIYIPSSSLSMIAKSSGKPSRLVTAQRKILAAVDRDNPSSSKISLDQSFTSGPILITAVEHLAMVRLPIDM